MAVFPHIFRKRGRRLGVSEGRRYDLPLNKSAGNGFLVLLIALMTFLAVLALSASFALSEMTARWSSGLENRLTVEIPAEDGNGKIRKNKKINALKGQVKVLFKEYPGVKSFEILDDAAIQDLISPWLGDDFALEDLPLPALIAVEATENTDVFLNKLTKDLREIDSSIKIDTHEDWLKALLGLIGSLEFSTLLVTLIIALTGVTAIAGAIRSRMAEHRPDIELLHLMGASDSYISRQFQRHALILGLQGGVCGLLLGAGMLWVMGAVSGDNSNGLIPDFKLGTVQIVFLLLLPVLACGLSSLTARFTVLRELARMP